VDGIITIDEYGTIETVNPAAQRLFGFASEELIGKNVKLLKVASFPMKMPSLVWSARSCSSKTMSGP
jgi:PAS domain S-box-containing protein